MVRFILIHGAYGNPEENWFPWLKKELESKGHEVIVPKLPTPENQELEKWMKQFEQHKDKISNDTVLIGHSLGVAFILNVLERIDVKIKAAFLVSGFIGKLGIAEFDDINQSFTEREFDWNRIKQNCEKFFVMNSDNDPYVPLKKGEEIAENLDTDLTIVKEGGHINSSAGFDKFELLLRKIEEIL